MRGWYRPSDRKWIEMGGQSRYDHAAAMSCHGDDFKGVLRETEEGLRLLPSTTSPEPDDEVVDVYDVRDMMDEDLDPTDVAVQMGWVRVNCEPSLTTSPYIHAGSEQDLKAGMDYVRSKGIDLTRADREGFRGDFSGNVIAMDIDGGTQRHVEYGFGPGRRLVVIREVEFGSTPSP